MKRVPKKVKDKISDLIKNHKQERIRELYGDGDHEWKKLGIKKIKIKSIREGSIDNLKQGSLEYFYSLLINDKKKLLRLLDFCKQELSLVKIKGKREYWCCGAGNNRPFFLKHFGKLVGRDWIYADVDEMTPD